MCVSPSLSPGMVMLPWIQVWVQRMSLCGTYCAVALSDGELYHLYMYIHCTVHTTLYVVAMVNNGTNVLYKCM